MTSWPEWRHPHFIFAGHPLRARRAPERSAKRRIVAHGRRPTPKGELSARGRRLHRPRPVASVFGRNSVRPRPLSRQGEFTTALRGREPLQQSQKSVVLPRTGGSRRRGTARAARASSSSFTPTEETETRAGDAEIRREPLEGGRAPSPSACESRALDASGGGIGPNAAHEQNPPAALSAVSRETGEECSRSYAVGSVTVRPRRRRRARALVERIAEVVDEAGAWNRPAIGRTSVVHVCCSEAARRPSRAAARFSRHGLFSTRFFPRDIGRPQKPRPQVR